MAIGISQPTISRTVATYSCRTLSPLSVMRMPVNGWGSWAKTLRPYWSQGSTPWPLGYVRPPSTPFSWLMLTSILRNVKPRSIRALRRFPISTGSRDAGVSAYIRILSRNLPPSICQHGTPQALPARSQQAISIETAPPAWRPWKPNCLIFRKTLSTWQGFSPSTRLLSMRA